MKLPMFKWGAARWLQYQLLDFPPLARNRRWRCKPARIEIEDKGHDFDVLLR